MKKYFFVFFLFLVVVSAGCGKEENTEETSPLLDYTVQQVVIPNPDESITDKIVYMMENDYKLVEDKLYRLVTVIPEGESKVRWYLQTLSEPYEAWNTIQVDFASKFTATDYEYTIHEQGLTDTGDIYITYGRDGEADFVAILQDGEWSEAGALPTAGTPESIFTADRDGLYRQEGKQSEKILSWNTYGISLNDAPILGAESGGHLVLSGTSGSGRVLLVVDKKGDDKIAPKQRVTIAAYMNPFLQKAIVDFNNQSDVYEIVVRDCSQESWEDIYMRFQTELAAGEGPDLIDSLLIQLCPYARNGYLEPLDAWLSTGNNLLPQAVDSGKAGGHCYIIPYNFGLQTLLTTTEIAEGRTEWTLEEMLEVMSKHSAEAFYRGARGWDVLCCMMCYDEENYSFVDWENKICHFETEEFVTLLENTKEWADSREQSGFWGEMSEDFREGHVLVSRSFGMRSLDDFYSDLNQLGSSCVYIGYPVENGNGTFLDGRGLAVNSSSKCKEGAKAFLEYLISPEMQLEQWRQTGSLPVDQNVLWQIFTEIAKEELPYRNKEYSWSSDDRPYNQEEAEQYYQMILNSRMKGKQYEEIMDILSEEADSFYEGNRDPWEVAQILQNRVQLYLNEQQ